jgi:hypothetical protein
MWVFREYFEADRYLMAMRRKLILILLFVSQTKLWRWIGARGEIRDFYTGSPAYNLTGITGGQHNVVAGGGFVLKWGEWRTPLTYDILREAP